MQNYTLIKSISELQHVVARLLKDAKPFGFDIETGYWGEPREKASLHPEESLVAGVSLGTADWAVYVPLAHDLSVNLPAEQVAEVLQPLADSGLGVAHNAKFEIRHLSQPLDEGGLGQTWKIYSDTMLEAYCLQEHKGTGLKFLTMAMFGHDQANITSLWPGMKKKDEKSMRFNTLDLTPEVIAYACEDALWCVRLHERQYPKIKDSFIFKLEMAMVPIMVEMESYGLFYNWSEIKTKSDELELFLEQLEAEIMSELTDLAGELVQINLGSTKQLAEVLFNKLGLPVGPRTDGGDPSTGAIALTQLAKKSPVVQKILWWKECKKLLSTYLIKYQRSFSYADDGRTHPNMLAHAVISGRFAVSDPPYQQTPKKYAYQLDSGHHFECNFRTFIQPGPDHYFLYYDYSQVELRWLAGVAQEPGLLRPFAEGTDVHTATASLMLGVPESDVDEDQRAIGKTMNFALLYGMGVNSLQARLAISKAEAQELYDSYFTAFTSIDAWMENQKREGKHRGYTTSHLGRKHRIWEFDSPERMIYKKGERLCVNAPIQGGAADYMKVAMQRQHLTLAKHGLLDQVHLVMNNHDSLTWEVHRSLPPGKLIKLLDPAVSFEIPTFPPIKADWAVATENWGELVEVDVNTIDETSDCHQIVTGSPYEVVEEPSDTRTPAPPVLVERLPEPSTSMPDEPTTVIVEIVSMPTAAQYGKWKQELADRPGSHVVRLVTPEGELTEDETSSIALADQPWISMIFKGATVTLDANSVDASSIMEGISL